MGVMPGTMGLALPSFLAVWLLMMTAMMLPGVTPVARLYLRTMAGSRRATRTVAFLAGYLLIWTVAGIPGFALAWLAGEIGSAHPTAVRVVGASTFLVVAIYQVSPWKDTCLKACRSPLGLLLRYAGYRGPTRDLRAGIHHGLYCLGCCWALFVALVAVGVMSIFAMTVVAAAVTLEKVWRNGVALSRVLALASLATAVLVALHPEILAGLYQPPTMGM
jgi:predicted metal-binding membrane protein